MILAGHDARYLKYILRKRYFRNNKFNCITKTNRIKNGLQIMKTIGTLLINPEPNINLCFWEDDHSLKFDVKIPYAFEYYIKELIFGFSTSFKHFVFVTKMP